MKEIKRKFGCGGSYQDGVMELQGDKVEALKDFFIKQGFNVKRSGK